MDAANGCVWTDHQKLVSWAVWRIARKYNKIDVEELESEALVLYAKALETYEPYCGSLTNWITFSIHKGLLEVIRTEARRFGKTGPMGSDEVLASAPNRTRRLIDNVIEQVSTDARLALSVFLELPDGREINKSLIKLQWRNAIKAAHDWSNERINRCFAEIEAAL